MYTDTYSTATFVQCDKPSGKVGTDHAMHITCTLHGIEVCKVILILLRFVTIYAHTL